MATTHTQRVNVISLVVLSHSKQETDNNVTFFTYIEKLKIYDIWHADKILNYKNVFLSSVYYLCLDATFITVCIHDFIFRIRHTG